MTIRRRRLIQIVAIMGLMMVAGVAKKASSADLPEGWYTDWTEATAKAKQTGKPILAVFSTSWCPPCRMMIKDVFPKESVKKALNDWVPVYIDGDKHTDMVQKYQIRAYPSFVLMTASNDELFRFMGYKPAESFVQILNQTGGNLKKIEQLQTQLKKEPEDAALWADLGRIYMDQANSDKALSAFEKAAYLDPKDAMGIADDLYLIKAMPKSPKGVTASEKKLAAFAEKFPKSDLRTKAAFIQAELNAYYLNDTAKAAEVLNQALKQHPDSDLAPNMKMMLSELEVNASPGG